MDLSKMGSFKRRLLIFGSQGQVASALKSIVPDAICISQAECDFGDPRSISAVLDSFRPTLVINPAAYTDVDNAEIDFERAKLINGIAPGKVAVWCAANSASLIHFSTDYVYSGEGDHPWSEESETNPINKYGETKLMGDKAIQASGCHYVILRTSWVFSSKGKNFVKTMLKLGVEREELNVVADQFGSPTSALDLASAVAKIINHPGFSATSGIFHCAGAGYTSWHGFAEKIFELAKPLDFPLKVKRVVPILSRDYPSRASRPKNSRLNTDKLKATFNTELPSWHESLSHCLRDLR